MIRSTTRARPAPPFLRQPVSATRSRIGWGVLAVLATGAILFRWTTSDEQIRRRAEGFLRAVTHGEVTVKSARFSLFGGIHLSGVQVATPLDPGLDPNAHPRSDREIFSASTLVLSPDPWQLLLFRLRVRDIVATNPRFTIAQDVATGAFNWQSLAASRTMRMPRRLPARPHVRLRDAEVCMVSVDSSGRHTDQIIRLDVDAVPQPDSTTAYAVDVRQYGDRPNRVPMVYDPSAGTISAVPAVGLRTVRGFLPKKYRDFFDSLRLEGEIHSEQIRFQPDESAERTYRLRLAGVHFEVPLSMLGTGTSTPSASGARDAHAIVCRFEDIDGSIDLVGETVSIDLRGRLNGAPCELKGDISRIDESLEHVGLNLEFTVDQLAMPDGSARESLLASDSVPEGVRDFLKTFDPRGPVDVRGALKRDAGQLAQTEFSGVLRPRGIDAAYRFFPYRLRDVNGQVRFTPEGVWIEPLVGRHGPAAVRIEGYVTDTTWYSGFEVRFGGVGVPLDETLYRALQPEYQRLWLRFDPRGSLRADVRVIRPKGDAARGARPTEACVQLELLDVAMRFDEFPYPLEHVRGHLSVAPGVIRIDGLTGTGAAPAGSPLTSQPVTVRADGYYIEPDGSGEGESGLELRLEARNLALDDRILAALPGDARIAFEQFRPSGWIDLLGRVFTDSNSAQLNYDLIASVHDAGLCYQELPYPITGMSGQVHITPEQVTLLDLHGSHGPTQVTARGHVRQTDSGYRSEITMHCRDLRLDAEMEVALTPELRTLWHMFDPGGSIDLTTVLYRVSEGSRTSYQHRSNVQLNGASARYVAFPLRLTDLRGDLRLSDRRVEFQEVRGRSGEGTVSLNGSIDVGPGGAGGLLIITASDLSFDDALTSAIPDSLRDTWRSLALRGRFDLNLECLIINAESGQTDFEWKGAVTLRDAAMRMGVSIRDVSGTIGGRGSAGSKGLEYEGNARLTRAVIGPLDLRNLTFNVLVKPQSDTLELQNCSADLFGGTAGGECTVQLGRDRSGFRLSMNFRDAELRQYLQATQRGSDVARTARGQLFGKLFLRGDSSRPEQMRGGGEVFIREAQVWKLPLVFEIFKLLNLTPDENMFHDGWLKFYIDGRTAHLTKIDLQGAAIALIGSGTLNLDTDELNVRLLAGSPQRLRVPIVTELVEGATRDLFELHITGTPTRPRIETRPLSNLRRALEAIFPREADRSDDRP